MIIESVQAKNFRSVLDETLQCENLTALVGANGAGKSTFLRALEVFYTTAPRIDLEDFYNRDTASEIVVGVTFKNLSNEAKELFSPYLQGEKLTVERVFSWQEGKVTAKYHGSSLQSPEFQPVRDGLAVKDRGATAKQAYNSLRVKAEYTGLPAWSTIGAVEPNLRQWEAANPDRCARQRDDGQFFGFGEVGQGYLGKFTRFLFIPAVRDAADDAAEGRGSVLSGLMDLVVRSVLANKDAVKKLKENTQRQYEEILDPSKLTELTDLSDRMTTTLKLFVPDAGVELLWLPLGQIEIPMPKADVKLVEDGFKSAVMRTGHGLQRAFILTLLQHLAFAQTQGESQAVEAKEGESAVATKKLPNLVLAIEEPELYQHPNRQRHLAKILMQLSSGKTPGVADKTQIIYGTHSPLFVGIDRIEQIRLLRKINGEATKPKISKIVRTALDKIAEIIWTADGANGNKYTGETLLPRLQAIMTPWMSEGFFADVAVLVEGEDDRAAILGMASLMNVDLESAGFSIIPCGGKTSLDRPSAIFRELGIPNQAGEPASTGGATVQPAPALGIGEREFAAPLEITPKPAAKPTTRIDQWKSRLLDLSLRNRLLNFRETKSTIRIVSTSPDRIEDELAAERELSLRPRPKVMSEDDPRNEAVYTQQQRADALAEHLADELKHGRLHTNLDESEHARRLTELFRSARNAIEENGTNTLFAAVGFLEWRETEFSDRIFRAPLLLVPVELKRKSVIEGFALRRLDEETRLNVTLMEMLRQHFQKEIPGVDPLPEDQSGVDVNLVFRIFRDAVRDLPGWEVKTEVWLGQFSFTKFLLWKDLADRLDNLTRNRVVNHLVNEAGTPYPNPSEDIRPEQLDYEFHPRDIFCPRSVDSSQLAAVMAAAAGHDFVLEGPPGTGKSQTIANIIAHCLAHGKRVLFVAEKRAALDVVFRRLREEGLEPFCLELHSNKTGKADVVAQFDRSLRFINDDGATDWEHRAAELERLRDTLNGYARALHRLHDCGLSAYRCLDYLLPRQKEPMVHLDSWPSILNTPIETLERAREVAKLLQQRSRPLIPLADHPLSLLGCDEWTPAWADRVLGHIRELGPLVKSAADATGELRSWLRCPSSAVSKADITNLSALVDSLLAPEPVGGAFATTPWNQLSTNLDKWISLVRERCELRDKLAEIHKLQVQGKKSVVCETWSSGEAEEIFKQCRQMDALTRQATEAAADLHTWISFPRKAATRTDIAHLVAVVDSLLAPAPVGEQFATAEWREWVAEFDQWIALVRERIELRARLAGYDEPKLLALDLDILNQKWQSAQKAWFLPKWLRLTYIRRRLRTTRPDQTRPDPTKMGEVITAALRLRAINGELAKANSKAETLLGPVWSRGEPQLDHLVQVRAWGAALHERLATLVGEDKEWMPRLRELIASLFKQDPTAYEIGTAIGNRLNRYRDAITQFDAAYEPLSESAALHRGVLDEAPDHLSAVISAFTLFQQCAPRLRAIDNELNATAGEAQGCLGAIWAQGEPSVEALVRARTWGEPLHARMLACAGDDLVWLGQLRQLIAGLFSEGPSVYATGTAIGDRLLHFREAQTKFQSALNTLAADVRLRQEPLDAASDYFPTVQNLLQRIPAAWHQIREWCFWQKVRDEGMKLGLAPIIATLEAPNGETLDIPTLFERSFRRDLFFATIENESSLREFFGREQNERIDRFCEVDAKIARLVREIIRARLAAHIPRDQVKNDIPKGEIGLLRHEIGKKMRHIPVRQLLSRIPNLLPRLKPCVLMSPLSVAQYLEPSHAIFDVVVFDEASQIPVWDAIGAIARGQQLIVVGDPKQLPPTNFFNSAVDDDESLAPEEFKDLESILDELMTQGLRHKRLQWHYRSRHEGLIAFSNRQYYENELLTFPSAETTLGGVKFKYLPQARYDKGKSRTNRAEAEALVAELVARLRNSDGRGHSYGVVTFSLAQQQLIENLLDEERRKYPEIEVHFGDEPPVEGEPVFVKNLENVQGDERDEIFFSICYGIDEAGRVSMNFGPLNRDGGERRLNVAITRAKHEVVVFSGLRADQIDLTRTRARGVRDLKYFLDYAERGPSALAAATSASQNGEPDSEFERMVAKRLREAGYEVHHQVGCSGYRIDLGVVDPANSGRYQLGVECDGATYHRAATARDRDKLRQLILEGLGWTLYRIWSTDWWHDCEAETKKLLTFLEGLSKT